MNMKKIVLAIALALIAISAFAQEPSIGQAIQEAVGSVQGQTIDQVLTPDESLWSFLAKLPGTIEAQLFYALFLAGFLGVTAHTLLAYLRGDIQGNLFKYLFLQYPKQTTLAYISLIGSDFAAIGAHLFQTADGTFVGWLNVLAQGFTLGYAVDSISGKSDKAWAAQQT